MTILNAISWPLFFWIALGLLVLWILTTKTQIGRTIIEDETPWGLKQWERLLAIIGITVFILVSPLIHLIGILVLGGLYHVFVGDLSITKDHFLKSKSRKESDSLRIASDTHARPILICKSTNEARPKLAKQSLEKCLFSFPFIAEKPKLRHLNNTFEIEPHLSNPKYLSSLIDYISHAGFQVEQKN